MKPILQWHKQFPPDTYRTSVHGLISLEAREFEYRWMAKVSFRDQELIKRGLKDVRTAKVWAEIMAATIGRRLAAKLHKFVDKRRTIKT